MLADLQLDASIEFDKMTVEYGGNIEESPTALVFSADPAYLFKCLTVASNNLLQDFTLSKKGYKVTIW